MGGIVGDATNSRVCAMLLVPATSSQLTAAAAGVHHRLTRLTNQPHS